MSKNASQIVHDKDMLSEKRKATVGGVIAKIFTYLFLAVMALIVIFPFYWMIISSLKTLEEYRYPIPTLWPNHFDFLNYAEAFQAAKLLTYFKNTVIVGLVSTILSLVITVLSAFAFARLEFKGKNLLFAALLGTMKIPSALGRTAPPLDASVSTTHTPVTATSQPISSSLSISRADPTSTETRKPSDSTPSRVSRLPEGGR